MCTLRYDMNSDTYVSETKNTPRRLLARLRLEAERAAEEAARTYIPNATGAMLRPIESD